MKKLIKIKCLFAEVIYFCLSGTIMKEAINFFVQLRNGTVIYYDDRERKNIVDFIKRVKGEVQTHMTINEAYQIFMIVHRTQKIEGDIAEVGVYRGGSARIICEAKGNKHLHLFDTFEGLPPISKYDEENYFHEGEFSGTSLKEVKNYLKDQQNVKFYKGLFPSTALPVKNRKFSFVNLDVDIFESTLNSLKFFYPRMNKGGIIISHDYQNAIGVRKAFDDFFKNKKEPVIELSGSQCLIVKL